MKGRISAKRRTKFKNISINIKEKGIKEIDVVIIKKANQLQFLRFFCFIFIFLWHCKTWYQNESFGKYLPGINSAYCAVSFFFILSGFITGYSSFGKKIKFGIKEIFKEMIKKLKKIYPLYFMTTLATILLSPIPTYISTHSFNLLKIELIKLIKNLLLIQSWFNNDYFSYCGVGWFLSTIMFLYLFNVPFKALLNKINKSKFRYLIFSILFFSIIFIEILYVYSVRNTNLEFYAYIFPISRLAEYLSAMILGYSISSIINKKKLIDKNKYEIKFTIIEILSIIFWIFCIYYKFNDSYCYTIIRWIIPNFLLIISFIFNKGYLSKLFKNKYLLLLGNISFEFFIIHQTIINYYKKLTGLNSNLSLLGNIFSIMVCLIITIVISIKLYNNRQKNINKM